MKEIEAYTAKKIGGITLNANELYCNLSASLRKEIMETVGEIDFNRYPDETSSELIEAYAGVMDLSSDQILAGNGSDEMLGLMIGYFLGHGKKMMTLQPDFSMYDYYASMHEVSMVKFATAEDGSFNVEEFIEQGREQNVDMIMFSNPNNPTGFALDKLDLCKIVEAFPKIPVLIDEAYGEFAEETMLDQLETYPNLYVTRTLSKAFGLAGARIGFLMSCAANIQELKPYLVPYNLSTLAQKTGCVILSHAQEFQELITEIKKERRRVFERVKKLRVITFYPSSANYLYGRSTHKQRLLDLLEEAGILIRIYGDDTLRITIGSMEENDQVLAVLEAFDKEACS